MRMNKMGKIYVDQTALKIDLDTGINLTTGVDFVYIKYQKPGDETILQWDGTVDNITHIIKILSGGEIDTKGDWTFWAYVKFTDGSEAPGEPSIVAVHMEGN
jgi:hypothetical protein